MHELLTATAERAIRYLEGLNERGVAPDPAVVARLAELAIPLSTDPSPANETVALLDASAVHAGIDVEKNSHAAAAPLADLFVVFGQDGNADLGELTGDCARPAGIGADRWIGQQNVGRTALAGDQELERGGALEIADAALDQHAQGVA